MQFQPSCCIPGPSFGSGWLRVGGPHLAFKYFGSVSPGCKSWSRVPFGIFAIQPSPLSFGFVPGFCWGFSWKFPPGLALAVRSYICSADLRLLLTRSEDILWFPASLGEERGHWCPPGPQGGGQHRCSAFAMTWGSCDVQAGGIQHWERSPRCRKKTLRSCLLLRESAGARRGAGLPAARKSLLGYLSRILILVTWTRDYLQWLWEICSGAGQGWCGKGSCLHKPARRSWGGRTHRAELSGLGLLYWISWWSWWEAAGQMNLTACASLLPQDLSLQGASPPESFTFSAETCCRCDTSQPSPK